MLVFYYDNRMIFACLSRELFQKCYKLSIVVLICPTIVLAQSRLMVGIGLLQSTSLSMCGTKEESCGHALFKSM